MYIMPGLNKACMYVVNLTGWQRYFVTTIFVFILSALWYLTLYTILEKKRKQIEIEIVQIIKMHQEALLSKQAIVQLNRDCNFLKKQIDSYVQLSDQHQLDLITFYKIISDNKIIVEHCTVDQSLNEDNYLIKKMSCLFKTTFEQLMTFLTYLKKSNNFFGCQELLIHKNDQGLLLVQGIFESIALRESNEH